MSARKSQLDTLKLFLKRVAPEDEVEELLEKFKEADEEKAQKAVKMFEQRTKVSLDKLRELVR